MKKHLHGKRYMIARRSVRVGRTKRQMHKIERRWRSFNRSIVLMALGMKKVTKEIQRVFERVSAATGVPLKFLIRSGRDVQDQN